MFERCAMCGTRNTTFGPVCVQVPEQLSQFLCALEGFGVFTCCGAILVNAFPPSHVAHQPSEEHHDYRQAARSERNPPNRSFPEPAQSSAPALRAQVYQDCSDLGLS